MIKQTLRLAVLFTLPVSAFAKTHTFYVEMACGNCSAKITKEIEQHHQGQYTNLVVDYDKDIVTLESDTLSRKEIQKTIEEEAKFPVSDKPIHSEQAPKTKK